MSTYTQTINTLEDFLKTSKFYGTGEFQLFSSIIMQALEDCHSLEVSVNIKLDAVNYLRSETFRTHLGILGLSYQTFKVKHMGFQ